MLRGSTIQPDGTCVIDGKAEDGVVTREASPDVLGTADRLAGVFEGGASHGVGVVNDKFNHITFVGYDSVWLKDKAALADLNCLYLAGGGRGCCCAGRCSWGACATGFGGAVLRIRGSEVQQSCEV